MKERRIIQAIREPRTMDEWKYKYLYRIRPEFIAILLFAYILGIIFVFGGSK